MNKSLTKIDLMFKQLMLDYPTLFPSRIEVWIHLFTGVGNGYIWNEDGELERSPDLAFEEKHNDKIPYPDNEDPDTETIPELAALYKLNRASIDIRNEFIDDIVVDTTFKVFTRRDALSVGWTSRLCAMFRASKKPERIAPEWREEIWQFCQWFKSSTWALVVTNFCVSLQKKEEITSEMILDVLDGSKLRKLKELHENYKMILEVEKNILLPAEKKKKQEHENYILNLAKQAVEECKIRESQTEKNGKQ